MIAAEHRGRALGVAMSVSLHVLALMALQVRSTDPPVSATASETVLEATLWPAEDGQSAAGSSSLAPDEAPPPDRAAASGAATDPSDLPRSPREPSFTPSSTEEAPSPGDPSVSDTLPSRSPPDEAAVVSRSGTIDRASPERLDGPEPAEIAKTAPEMHTGPPKERKVRQRPIARTPARTAGAQERLRSPGRAEPDQADREGRGTTSASGGRLGRLTPHGSAGTTSDLAAYLVRVRARIASRQAASGGEQGHVGIRFDVAGDGSFTGLAAISGDRGQLADAALRIVRRASPAPPIPPSLGQSRISVIVMIVFE